MRPRAIAHVDMDAFYASIEQRDRPELRGRPVIVGASPTGRGVVSAASYEARPYGVRSAMPISRAARLCPHAAFVPVDMQKYQRVSAQIMGILVDFSPLVEPVSVDEAFVDLSGTDSLFGSPLDAVRLIKRRILAETGLTASAGLAANKFVAKVASELEKPDGLVVVVAGDEARFLGALPIERLWGVGRVMAKALGDLGFTTIGQLQRAPRSILGRRFGKHGEALHDLAFGRDDRPVEPYGIPKSIGAEETFGVDCTNPAQLKTTLRAHAERVAAELREGGFSAGRVTLKLRLAPFETHTRSVSGEPTQDGLELYRRALALLERDRVTRPVRLIGLSASRLGPSGKGQLDLLDPAALRRERLARVVDRLTARFGEGTVIPAVLLPEREGE
ncbi:MAG: DNA polymerase IV [Candidatus Rokuibacteriota bacterium]|nr:MAG: DNA polymerase IV [Candidatus Rokubacteria bacterium]